MEILRNMIFFVFFKHLTECNTQKYIYHFLLLMFSSKKKQGLRGIFLKGGKSLRKKKPKKVFLCFFLIFYYYMYILFFFSFFRRGLVNLNGLTRSSQPRNRLKERKQNKTDQKG